MTATDRPNTAPQIDARSARARPGRQLPDDSAAGPARSAHAARLGRAVVGQEQLLERRLPADEAAHADPRPGRRAPARIGRVTSQRTWWSLASTTRTPGTPRQVGRRPGELGLDGDSAERWRMSRRRPTSTSRPARRMATRSHSASTSLRMCDDRNTVWPRPRASSTHSRNTCSISGSRPLVGSSSSEQVGPGHEGGDQHDLLAVALRVGPHPLRSGRARTARPARRGTPRRRRRATRPSTCSVSAPVSDGHRLASPGTKAIRRWAATGSRWQSMPKISARPAVGPDQAEQQPDRGGLAGAVRARGSRGPRPGRCRGGGPSGRRWRRSAWSARRCGRPGPCFTPFRHF